MEIQEAIVEGMLEKKASNVVLLDLKHIPNAVADYFVIASGNSDVQLSSIADEVEKQVEEQQGEKPWHKEGFQNREWVLLDYGSVVAHIFRRDKRDFYGLEELWGDAKATSYSSDGS